ncbi:MAG: hypothetical protein ACXWLR_10745 [Myxococcales bacterium]
MIVRILAPLVLVASAVRAESHFGDAGTLVPSGSISYRHFSGAGASTDSFLVGPELLWFPVTWLAIGGGLTYGYFSGQQISPFVFQPATHSLGIQPTLGVALPLGDSAALFPRVSLQLGWQFPENFSSTHFVSVVAFAPVLLLPVPHFFLGLGPVFTTDLSAPGAKATTFGLASEVGGYF